MRDAAASAPYDFLEILVNEKQYGGGGIFNDQATASVDTGFAEYVFVHEFGHHFAGLADEYYTSDVAYETGGSEHPEPWEPNVTANGAQPKWMRDGRRRARRCRRRGRRKRSRSTSASTRPSARKLREANVPESQMDELFRREQEWETKFLGAEKYAGKVGAFEGAGYEAEGPLPPARRTASCSRATRSGSATSARARSSG